MLRDWAATTLRASCGICSFVLALSHCLIRNETRLHILRNFGIWHCPYSGHWLLVQKLLLADADWANRDCEIEKSPAVREFMCGWLSCLGPSQGWAGHLRLPGVYSVGFAFTVSLYAPAQSACCIWLRNKPMGWLVSLLLLSSNYCSSNQWSWQRRERLFIFHLRSLSCKFYPISHIALWAKMILTWQIKRAALQSLLPPSAWASVTY